MDHIVGAGDQCRWHGKTKCLGSLEVDDEVVLGWQLNWKIARFLAFENAGDINASTAISIRLACSEVDRSWFIVFADFKSVGRP